MAEIKNNFLKSKMNKDLDARLLPNGEYRDAQNINISRSEGPDVGAIENVLGNIIKGVDVSLKEDIANLERQKVTDKYGTFIRPGEIQLPNLEIIGYYMDIFNDKIYLFLTDYSDGSNDQLSNFAPADYIDTGNPPVLPGNFIYKGAGCYIVEYGINTNTYTVLVAGNFLNFSKTQPILNVNLLEDLLFFTDNRNQPRKINVKRAFDDSYQSSGTANPYYYNEDQISVSKFAPYEPFGFLDTSNDLTLISNSEEYLPAHIVTTADYDNTLGKFSFTGSGTTNNYSNSGVNPDLRKQDVGVIGDRITINDIDQYIVTATSSSTVTSSTADQKFYSDPVRIEVQRANPDYSSAYEGDSRLLKDDFAKFSYRFKYDDGEYSIMAPFTQAAFIPKQFGYFINEDEQITLESGNVSFMENMVDQVKLNLRLPVVANQIEKELKVSELQILVKNSDEVAVRVVEDVPVSVLAATGTVLDYQYNYLSSKPIKVLPEADLIRVFDKVPVRAVAQEIVSNRVVYGNFLDKHSSPDNLNYDLIFTNKTFPTTLPPSAEEQARINFTNEFPLHTLKQNRSYQVGIVLVDRYGRSSNVILNDASNITAGSKNSTIYAPYNNYGNNSVNYVGDYLELALRSEIPSSLSKNGYPGLYSSTNPLGYYSYRIVVKQQEQDYYNVYTPGALAGDLLWDVTSSDGTGTITPIEQLPSYITTNRISMINLFGDNINKVPRDLKDVNGNDVTFGSRSILYNRVNPIFNIDNYNTQSNVSLQGEKVISIEPFRDLGEWTTTKGSLYPNGDTDSNTPPQPWYPYYLSGSKYNFHDIFFNAQANPFIATIETDFKIGVTPTYVDKSTIESAWQDLGVFETEPTVSSLDIYWESSTSGLISVLNQEVVGVTPVGVKDTGNNNTALGGSIQYIQTEALAGNSDITLTLNLVNSGGADISANYTVEIDSVIDGSGSDRTSEFDINTLSATTFRLKTATNSTFVFNQNSNVNENYTFNLLANYTSGTDEWTGEAPIQITNCQLQNIAPIFNNQPSTVIREPLGTLFTLLSSDFENGSIDTSREHDQIEVSVVDAVTLAPYNSIYSNPTLGSDANRDIIADGGAQDGEYKLKIVDANGTGLAAYSNTFTLIITTAPF